MSAYCAIADVYRWIPPGSVQNRARLVSSINTSTDVLTIDGHGLETNDPVKFRAEAGGSLPTGVVAGTTYYAQRLSDATFKILDAAGGNVINLTDSGENVVATIDLPWDAWIAEASNEIECTLPSTAVPLTAPYPAVVIAYTAGLVAEKALGYSGTHSIGVTERLKLVRSEFKEWRAKGLVIRGACNQTSSNLAISSGPIDADARDWAVRGNKVLP